MTSTLTKMTNFLSYFWIDISCSSSLYFSCRNLPSQPIIFRGHSDGISSFSIWGQDVISISRNRIGLLSLSKSVNETVCLPFFEAHPCVMRIGISEGLFCWLCIAPNFRHQNNSVHSCFSFLYHCHLNAIFFSLCLFKWILLSSNIWWMY